MTVPCTCKIPDPVVVNGQCLVCYGDRESKLATAEDLSFCDCDICESGADCGGGVMTSRQFDEFLETGVIPE